MRKTVQTQRKGGKAKKITNRFTIDCSTPVEDEIMDVAAFVSTPDLVLFVYNVCIHNP